eukprot:TRINITY_DN1821_c0_g1_i3.p1 TRINITY_DN1821_c0_g1~~TRINITY_DN1821_c0_g1_i3.p1  ORF type:complete len:453 (+),score=91.74 TRINITY_DN1821_c0_g1_i3:59-1360(+)
MTKRITTNWISRHLASSFRRSILGRQLRQFSKKPKLDFFGSGINSPCIQKINEIRASERGPEPTYGQVEGYKVFQHNEPFDLEYGGRLPQFQLAYETWGTLSEAKDNVVLIHTGLSASSHAKSTPENPAPGWWENFIGPGLSIDTNKFFVICTNVLGGCYGSTGPSSIRAETNKPWGVAFPLVTVWDMVRAQFLLLDSLGIDNVFASVGSSMGGFQSLAAAALNPHRVKRVVSISAAGRAHPLSIAYRFTQRRVLMADPDWNGGNYYGKKFPMIGMKHAREIGTITYRSGPEWEDRFGRHRVNPHVTPTFCPDFEIESYLDHQGEQWCLKYDPNSFLYISKAMDLFDLATDQESYEAGVARVRCPTLVIGVQSDILFPVWQQRELAHLLKKAGTQVTYYELDAYYGHDTFLIDVQTVGSALKGYLETSAPRPQ